MLRKALAIGGLSAASFSNGFVYGQMGGMIGALQRKEGGIELSEGQRSSIVSILTMMTLVGMGLAAYVTDKLGRRWPVIIFSLPSAIQWIILYHSYSMYHFMISRIVAGISVGGLITLTLFVTSEYTSPKTRAFYLNMVTTVASALGASLGHALGIVLHWRTVALIGIIPAVVSSVVPIFWVESPHWLASKERFEECEIAFRKLHGNNPSSERELSLIIKTEKSKLKQAKESNCKPTSKRLLAAFKRKYFWKLFLTTIFMDAYFAASGKLIFTSLATVILEEITGTADVLLYTLLVDCFVIIGSCLSCFLIRRTSLRTLLFSTGFAANAILVVFSGCYYFKNGQSYFNWINVSLLALYFVAVNAGPYPLLEVLFTEIFPLEIKAYAFAMSATILVPSVTSTVVLLPVTVSWIGYHGLFLLNAAIMSVSLGYIWLRLPETKGRTLQELEVFFKTNNFDVDEILCNNEQSKSLI